MKLLYLPALQPHALTNRWTGSPIHGMDRRLMGTSAFHPYGMTSYANSASQPFAWKLEDVVCGDSGGYTAAKQGKRFDPIRSLGWQMRTGCAFGPVLDSPPWDGWSRFRECLARTVADTKTALPTYLAARERGGRFRWWGVVQGRSIEELEAWWSAISNVYPFTGEGEGWAFRPAENTADAMRRVLTFIETKRITRAHFFASAAHHAVATLAFHGPQTGLDWASIDTTSTVFAEGAVRLLRIPRPYGPPKKTRDPLAILGYMLEKCGCPSCEFLRQDVQERPELAPTNPAAITASIYIKHRLIWHNTLAVVNEFATLHERYASRLGISMGGAHSKPPLVISPGKQVHRRDLAGLRSARWPEVLRQVGITVLDALPDVPPPGAILVTNCSREKGPKADYPQNLYLGLPVKRVWRYSQEHGWPFAVLSDEHGICFPDEKFEPYDTSPADLTDRELWERGQVIAERVREKNCRAVYYVGNPPSMTLPYQMMLLASGLAAFFCTGIVAKGRKKVSAGYHVRR